MRRRRPRLLDLQLGLTFVALAACSVVATAAIAAVTIAAQAQRVLARQEANDARAAALGAAVAYTRSPAYAGWQHALAPVIAVADQAGESLQVQTLTGRVVRSSAGFASFPSPAMTAPVLAHGRLVGSVVLKFGRRGLGQIVGHFEAQRWRFRLFAGGISIALAVLLTFVVTPLIVGPLDRLIGATRARGEGQLQTRVGPVRGLRDIRELTSAHDRMADAIDGQDQMRRNLFAYLAHELRTPITVLRASTEAMIDHVTEVTQEQIQSLHGEAVRLGGLVDRLQRMATAEAAFSDLEFRTDDLAVIASAAADSLDSVFRSAGVLLIRRLDGVPVRCDPGRMREVVTNLLTNAAKFTPAGGQVVLDTRASRDSATLQVSDTGPGIPPEDLPLVAKRFYRSAAAADVAGSGLGLAIADELVHAHGGSMTISSQLGRGTTVTIELPAQHEPIQG